MKFSVCIYSSWLWKCVDNLKKVMSLFIIGGKICVNNVSGIRSNNHSPLIKYMKFRMSFKISFKINYIIICVIDEMEEESRLFIKHLNLF